MDRRLISIFVGLALALFGSGVPFVLAQAPAPVPSLPPVPPAEPVPAPAEALPPPAAMPPPSETPALAPTSSLPDAPRDVQVERAQVPVQGARPSAPRGTGPDQGSLSPALEVPGQAGAGTSAGPVDPFVLPPEKLPLGRQSVALTVDVIAPPVLNLNQITTLTIVVRNTGTTDAMGVVVRDELPESLDYLSSQPEAERNGALLFWKLTTVPAGSEKKILVRVKTIKVGEFDHAATVTMLAGSKSRTTIREPKLKVEQTATSGKVLKGQPVTFKITISNPGDGPARNVVVQAKLSPGLRHESGEPNDQNLFEQTLPQIEPHQRIVLDAALVADTLIGGEQTCTVAAQSTDVTTSRDDAKNVATVTVIEPKLKVTIAGDEKRFTDTIATYTITVENPGTATAYNVYVAAALPLGGRLVGPPPTGGRWDSSIGKILLKIPQVEPGENEKLQRSFQVRVGNVGNYTVTVDARADGGLSDHTVCRTEVAGLVDFDFEVQEQQRVVDVDDSTMFSIRIKNIGTKAASNLLVRAKYSKNLQPLQTKNGVDDVRQAQFNGAEQLIVFPPIARLNPSQEVVMGIKVKAIGKGLGTCRVYVMHDDLTQDEQLEDLASFKITANRQ